MWYRAVELPHIRTPIDTDHTKATLSRFSPGPNANPPFEVLYLCESPEVAQFEIGAMMGDPLVIGGVLNAPRSFAVVNVDVLLQRVADLTRVSQQDLIDTTAQELTGDWRGYEYRARARSPIQEPVGTAPTQDLGEALFGLPGIKGFRALSAKLPYRRNLVVFPEKMFEGSRLEFRDASAKLFQTIPGTVPRTASRGWAP